MAATTLSVESQTGVVLCWPARIGTRAMSGIEARSWNSSTAKLSRPEVRANNPRSDISGRTMAVEESARPKPRMPAPTQGAPKRCARTVNAAPVTPT